MDKNTKGGIKRQVSGTVKEVTGKVTGNKSKELAGKAEKTLGKAQRVIRLLREAGYDETIYVHGALERLNRLYEHFGVELGSLAPATGSRADFAGRIIIAPPSALADRWSRRFPDPVTAFASGWMSVRARARQRGVELPLVLSDHADWDELTATLSELSPRRQPAPAAGQPQQQSGATR